MANLPESPTYEAGIYQLETTDEVIGGVNGVSNLQGKQLANRTAWLKDRVDTLLSAAGKTVPAFSAANTYTAGTIVAHLKTIWRANTTIPEGPFNPAQWTNLLGTAAAVDVVTSNTDTTSGRVPTVAWMGLGGPGVNVSFANNDFSSLIATGMGAPNSIYSVGLHIRGTANTAGNIAIRNNSLYHQSLESGVLGDWLRVWDTGNLVKTTSAADTTADRVLTTGYAGLYMDQAVAPAGGTSQDNNARVTFALTRGIGQDNRPSWIEPAAVHGVFTLPVSTGRGIQIAFSPVSAQGANRVSVRTYTGGVFQGWDDLWTTGNLVKTTSATDTTAGSVPTTGWLGNGRTLEYKSQATDDLNDFNVAGAHGMWGGSSLNRPTNNVYIVHVLGGTTSSVGGQIPSRIVQVAYQVGGTASYRRSYNGSTWTVWAEEWNSGNLVKTTSATDTTAGRMLQTGDAGWLKQLNSDVLGDADLHVTTGHRCLSSSAANIPSWATVNLGSLVLSEGASNRLVQFFLGGIDGSTSSISGAPRLSARRRLNNGAYSPIIEFYSTGNTSADVQAMLAAANNTAIRNAIGSLEAQYTVSSTYDAVRTGFWKGTAPGGDAPPNQDENNLAGISVTSPDAGAGFQIVNGAYDKELFFRGFDGTPSSADWKKFFFHGEGGFYGNAVVPGNTNGLDKSQIFYYTAANRPGGFMSANSGQGIHIAVNGSGAGMQLWAHHGAPTPRIAFRAKSNNVWDAPVEILHDKNLAEKMGKVTLVWSGSANSVSLSGYGYGLYMVKCQNVRAGVVYWNGEEDCSVVTNLAPMTAGGLHNVYVNKSGIVTSVQIIVETGSTNANIPINTIYKIG